MGTMVGPIRLEKNTSLPIGTVVRAGDEVSGGIVGGVMKAMFSCMRRALRFARHGRAPKPWGA